MKKTAFLILLLVTITFLPSRSQNSASLSFNREGTFKIAQFTDIHHKPGKVESEPPLQLISYILEAEKPDLIVFSGDIVTGKPVAEGWKEVLAPVVNAGIPFAVTLGNHDDEHDLSREQIRELLNQFPGYLGKNVLNASPYDDYVVHIKADRPEEGALLYFLESNAYSTHEKVKGYGWFSHDQVNWYRKVSRENALNDGGRLPALAYFHIPLPEYRIAFNSEAPRRGQRNEDECAPQINTGMFAAMLLEGDVMGTFTGHDHMNDYLVNHFGIALAYGRWSGGKNTYGKLLHGSRIVLLEKGTRSFDTWIHLRDGEIIDRILFPDDLKQTEEDE